MSGKTLNTGERQISTTWEGIRGDHLARYDWAKSWLRPGTRVLDAGCGIGYGAVRLASAMDGVTVQAIDRDAATIYQARQSWAHERVTYRVGNLHFLPDTIGAEGSELAPDSEDSRFHVITSFEVIEHLVSPPLFLRQLHRLARPDAAILLSVPNQSFIAHSVELNPFHIRHYTAEDFIELMQRCGLRVEKIFGQNNLKISENSEGQTHLLLCRPEPDYQFDQSTGQLLQAAFDDAEQALHERSQSIRGLQNLTVLLTDKSPRQKLGIAQLAMREHAAQTAAQLHLENLEEVRGRLAIETQQLQMLRDTHAVTISTLNRANLALQTYAGMLQEQREKSTRIEKDLKARDARIANLLGDLRARRQRIKQLSHDLEKLRDAVSRKKAVFDPLRPTLGGLFRLMRRHRFFVGILIKAPFNTAKNLFAPRRKNLNTDLTGKE